LSAERHARAREDRDPRAGFALVEALVALAVLALVLLLGLGLVWQQRRVLVRLEAREAADAALAEALEVLRSGGMPPVSGVVPVTVPVGPAEGLEVVARVTRAEPPPDLFHALLVARYRVAGATELRTVETRLWRPDLPRME
jgi:type II secretory pathway pseudopilin PulG